MLKAFKDFFEQATGELPADDAPNAELAAAALMMEIARADQQLDAAEQAEVEAAIQRAFGFDASAAADLTETARARAEESTSLYEFTRIINDNFDDAAKFELMLNLWKVAHADGNVDHYEAHLLRRIADLIHMRHGDYIAAKLKAAEKS